MKNLLQSVFWFSLCLLIANGTAFGATRISCVGSYREYKPSSGLKEKSLPLEITLDQGGMIRHEADLEGKNLSVLEEANLDLIAIISTAPDYTDGVLSKGTVNSQGEFKFSVVAGEIVHMIVCKKL